jgi:hypothetical protein
MASDDDRSRARAEAATLLGVDIERASPADALRIDMISALRLVIDHEQAAILGGNSADLGKLNVAVASLIALLPGSKLDEPASSRPDPRKAMWETYLAMRKRGELFDPCSTYEGMKAEVERLRAELAAIKAGVPAPDESGATVPNGTVGGSNVVPLARPAAERTTERSVVSPSAPAAPATGLLTDNVAEPWRPFVGGGAHYDRWSNRNE